MHVTINLEPAAPRLHAVQFSALVKHYLSERARRLDPSTIKSYRIRLNHFLRWWDEEGPPRAWILDEAAFADYALYVNGRSDWGWWNRHDALRRVRQVLRWAHKRGYVAVDFAEFVPTLRGSPPPRLPVALDTLRALFGACDQTEEPERNRAILAVLAGTGVRNEECAAMRVENVLVYEDGSGLITLSVAKNDNLRTVAFDPPTGSYICAWIVQLGYEAGPLFPSRIGRNGGCPSPITPSGQHKLLTRLSEIAGVSNQIRGAHDLRRLFATTWARRLPGQGHLLQKQMGHAAYSTTLLYVLDDPTDVREAMTKQPITPVAMLTYQRTLPRMLQARLIDTTGNAR